MALMSLVKSPIPRSFFWEHDAAGAALSPVHAVMFDCYPCANRLTERMFLKPSKKLPGTTGSNATQGTSGNPAGCDSQSLRRDICRPYDKGGERRQKLDLSRAAQQPGFGLWVSCTVLLTVPCRLS